MHIVIDRLVVGGHFCDTHNSDALPSRTWSHANSTAYDFRQYFDDVEFSIWSLQYEPDVSSGIGDGLSRSLPQSSQWEHNEVMRARVNASQLVLISKRAKKIESWSEAKIYWISKIPK